MLHTYNYVEDEELIDGAENELREKIKIGMFATLCCHRDMFEIKTQEDIDDIINNAENGYDVGNFEEINNLGREADCTDKSWYEKGLSHGKEVVQ